MEANSLPTENVSSGTHQKPQMMVEIGLFVFLWLSSDLSLSSKFCLTFQTPMSVGRKDFNGTQSCFHLLCNIEAFNIKKFIEKDSIESIHCTISSDFDFTSEHGIY